jgi:hypothetical protein
MGGFTWLRRSPRLALVALGVVLVVGAVAYAADPLPAILTSTPQSEGQITNVDVLKQQIRNYYGDPLGSGTFSDSSNYADEARSVAAEGGHWLGARAKVENRAIILDVDDTTLATYNYEIFSNWAFNSTTNGDFVAQQRFPAVPGMVDMVEQAAADGYAIIFLTGRPATQEAATLGNLTSDGIGQDAGYPAPTTLNDGEDGLFTKPAIADYSQYLLDACATELAQTPPKACTTRHYKTATREHVESLGYEIVANFGDQFSDLEGGFSDKTFKLPNPSYFLP